MLSKDILNKLKIGEHAVEMQECLISNTKIVYKVTLYTCKRGLFKNHYSEFIFPFYFNTKALAEEFLQHYDDFQLCWGSYWDNGDRACLMLYAKNSTQEKKYWMVDCDKPNTNKAQLTEGGVWGGVVNTSGRYSVCNFDNINYLGILYREYIITETKNKYCFIMVKE